MPTGAAIGALRVTLGLDTASFEAGAKRSRALSATFNKDVQGSFRSTAGSIGAFETATRSLLAPLAGLASLGAARTFLSMADESKNLAAQMKLATAQGGDFAVAMADVSRIASGTRSGLSETSQLYGNFVRATQQAGLSQADASRATETFSKVLKIGGADAASAASATLQFGQALASGVLRGDEFNSVAEASPRLVRLLADSLGVTQGEMRGLAEQGKLTSDVLFKALTDRKFTAAIDAEFRDLPVTFDQAMTLVHNAAVTTFGAFDEGGQFSTMLADFVGRGADDFANLAMAARTEGSNIRSAFAGLDDVFAPLLRGAHDAFGGVRQEVDYTRDTIATLLGWWDKVKNVGVGIDRGVQRLDNLNPFDKDDPLPAWSDTRGKFLRSFEQKRAELSKPRFAWSDRQNATIKGGLIGMMGGRAPGATPQPSTGKTKATGGMPKRAGASGPSLRDQTQQVLDAVLPDEAQERELREKMATLGKALAGAILDPDVYERAKAAILEKLNDLPGKIKVSSLIDDQVDLAVPVASARGMASEVQDRWKEVAAANDNLSTSFDDMLQSVTGSLQNLSSAIRGGDLLDIVSGALQAFSSLAGAGAFGTKLQTRIAGARAAGGPVIGGQTYLVGERGPELFTAPRTGAIVSNKDMRGGGRSISFDLRGAVMTADLLAQMQAIAADTSGQFVMSYDRNQQRKARMRLR